MPVYVYRVVKPQSASGQGVGREETFEVRQLMSEPALTVHPTTGEPVERVLFAPAIASNKLGNAHIGSTGLTKYVRTSDGSYERQAGSGGPKILNPND
jgi:predicted nucleic acid-binding Zn ribbon protein